MSIIVIILKIIGILILLLLLLTALLLFHPIFYRIGGVLKEDVSIRGYFWWLFQILRLEFCVEGSHVQFRIRIFGWSKEFGSQKEETEDLDPASAPFQDPDLTPQQTASDTKSAKDFGNKKDKTLQKNQFRKAFDTDGQASAASEEREEHRQTVSQKRTKERAGTFAKFKKEITDQGNRRAVARIWQEILYLLSHIKPKHIRAEILFSAGDPALTGEVTGALSLLPVMYRSGVHVYPDFLSEACFVRGSFTAKGHMALFNFVRSLIRLLFDKNIKRLYHKFRK